MAPPKKQGPAVKQQTLHSFFSRPVKDKVVEPTPVAEVDKEEPVITTESLAITEPIPNDMEVDQTSDEEVIAPPLVKKKKRVFRKLVFFF